MPKFSSKSQSRLDTCHPDIQRVFEEVIKEVDCTVLEGVRSLERQQELFDGGMSKTMNSRHLEQEDGYSHAIDVAPCPIDWEDRDRFILFAGYVLGVADRLWEEGEIDNRLVSGIDWNRNFVISDHTFFDGPHFQLDEP